MPSITGKYTVLSTGTAPVASTTFPAGFPFNTGTGNPIGASGNSTQYGYSGTYWNFRISGPSNTGDRYAAMYALNSPLDMSSTTKFIGLIASFNAQVSAATNPVSLNGGAFFCMLSDAGTGWRIWCIGGNGGTTPVAQTNTEHKRCIIDPRSPVNVVSESNFNPANISHVGPGFTHGTPNNGFGLFTDFQRWATCGVIDTHVVTGGDALDPITEQAAQDLAVDTADGTQNSPVAEQYNEVFSDTLGLIQIGNGGSDYYDAELTQVTHRGEVSGDDFDVTGTVSNAAGGGRVYNIGSGGTLMRVNHLFTALGKNKFTDMGAVAGTAISDTFIGPYDIELMNNALTYTGLAISGANSVVADAPIINGGSIRDFQSLYGLEINDTTGVKSFTVDNTEANKRGILIDTSGNATVPLDAWTFGSNLEYQVVFTGTGNCELLPTNGTVIDSNKLLATNGGTFSFPVAGASLTLNFPAGASLIIHDLDVADPQNKGTRLLTSNADSDGTVVYSIPANKFGDQVIVSGYAEQLGYKVFEQVYTLPSSSLTLELNFERETN